MQCFSLEVKHLLEAEWSTPKEILELPPARDLCHILLLLLSAASSCSPCGTGACLHLRHIHFRDLDLQEFHFCLLRAQLLLCFCFFFLPQPAHCRVNCSKVMLKEKGMRFFFCFLSTNIPSWILISTAAPLGHYHCPSKACCCSTSSRKIPAGNQVVQQLKCKFMFTKTHKF